MNTFNGYSQGEKGQSNHFSLNFSFYRIYFFLFFTGAYAFLSFWIGFFYVMKIFPFLIGGILFYLLVSLFHKAIIKLTANDQIVKTKSSLTINLFLLGLIIFCLLYIALVYFMQRLVISHLNIPANVFEMVNWGLNVFSLFISFLLSFLQKIKFN